MEYEFKTEPFDHQRDEFNFSKDLHARAVFWEQGTGKSKLMVDTACYLYLKGEIDAVVVVAPNGVHRNWVEQEIPDHVPEKVLKESRAIAYQSSRASTKWHQKGVKYVLGWKGLAWFTISYEAFVTKQGKLTLSKFFNNRKVFYILDEAHYIKGYDTKRTKSILKSAKFTDYRRILTGTPIAKGPFDLYSQLEFLDPTFWASNDLSEYDHFTTHFGIYKKIWNKTAWNPKARKRSGNFVKILDTYRRLDELNEMIQPICSRVKKEDVLDLPPKIYEKLHFNLSGEQARMYDQMREEFHVWLDGDSSSDVQYLLFNADPSTTCPTCGGNGEVNFDGFIYPCPDCNSGVITEEAGRNAVFAQLAMVRMLRLQQITCGYIPTEDDAEPMYRIPGENPRLKVLIDHVVKSGTKAIIWARFKEDINLILAALKEKGIAAGRYDGEVSEEDRAEVKARFQGKRAVFENGVLLGRVDVPEEEQLRCFVANPAAGATGLTLTAATSVYYYSNDFNLINRLQSEDRAHRIGQDKDVYYYDLVADNTIDEKIVESFRRKFNIASQILGDQLREWL